MDGRNIVLIGFMGSGKTVVGRILAKRLGRVFVDSDEILEAEEGREIARIFAESGEAYFRRREKEVLARVARGTDQVIATGGGAVLDPENLQALRRNGIIVSLGAAAETIRRRLANVRNRPLLTGDDPAEQAEQIRRLLAEREPLYRQADIYIATDALETPERVAEEVIKSLQQLETRRVEVNLGVRSYPIVIGTGLLSRLGRYLEQMVLQDPLLIVTNPTVGDLYLERVEGALQAAGRRFAVVQVPDGEEYKCLEQVARIYDAAVEAGLERNSAVLALGGGVIGDMAGFVAATYLRGVKFIQLPTTLLAQIDSSVGGKVAVNHPRGKNLIGCFYQPQGVFTDLTVLKSLTDRDYTAGLAEAVKSAVIRDAALFELLEAETAAINRRDPGILGELVERVCRIKADVVAEDEREQGSRAILNFGHTVGHAVETVTDYRLFRHGEAVAIGMVAATAMAAEVGHCGRELVGRISDLLGAFGLPTQLPGVSVGELFAAMGRDKKVSQGRVRFVLPRTLGVVEWGCQVPDEVVRRVLLALGARGN
ncbi:MAG TPA: 3-dehydroquinate synthase [Firmicutes bacterium]|nr:3-dehydroquinate synthase [Bacillota bacterium]HOQ23215.1 3-dehydroquinate synthase [Bacillota bacterium]HPT66644.1 3-dehydroquinate synthase [Bacillota bacterium]